MQELFREYEKFLGFDLCFQNFESELASLPGDYAPPRGALLVAREAEQLLGCVALRALEHEICEMKRLYLRPEARGKGLGVELCQEIIDRARSLGYSAMRLDTVKKLDKAIELYLSLGFEPCEPYCHNPQADVEYFELKL